MKKYLVVAPDKNEVVIASLYGSQKFKHGSYIHSEELAKAFPEFFVYIPEQSETKEKKVVKEEVKLETTEKENTVPKKKAGRPKKKG